MKKSKLEGEFEFQLSLLDLPFIAEHKFHPVRRWRFDFANLDTKIAVELHGGIFTQGRHSRGKGMEGDMEKINTAQIMGWDVLCFSGGMVKSGEAVSVVEEFYKQKCKELEQ